MSYSLNTIRKQTLQFQYNGVADGFVLQKEVSDWCNFFLIPEIEQQLDQYYHDENYLYIDRLEIEATTESNNWKQKIFDELIFNLKQKLANYNPATSESGNVYVNKKAKLDDLVIFYLEFGFLPWWGKTLFSDDFRIVLQKWITDEVSIQRAELIRVQLKQIISDNVIERIFNQVPQKLYFVFLRNIYNKSTEILKQLESFFNEEIFNNISPEKEKLVRKSIYCQLLKMLVEGEGEIASSEIQLIVYKELKNNHLSDKLLKPKPGKSIKLTNPLQQAWNELLISETIKQKRTTENKVFRIQKQLHEEIEATEITNEKQLREENKAEGITTETHLRYNKLIDQLVNTDLDKKNKDVLASELREGIFIDNSGAVIFAAFIPNLFKKLELEKDGKLVNPDLAVIIIQYCVSGLTNVAEYELVLPKILCGLDVEYPVNNYISLSEEQMNEADEMLQSLIEYWSVLKNTSVDGLRESFFKRRGKLTFENEEWILLVEQQSYDMLLERLPWSISMIKLPWMTNLLKTEWV